MLIKMNNSNQLMWMSLAAKCELNYFVFEHQILDCSANHEAAFLGGNKSF